MLNRNDSLARQGLHRARLAFYQATRQAGEDRVILEARSGGLWLDVVRLKP
jgi:hypothetical protein